MKKITLLLLAASLGAPFIITSNGSSFEMVKADSDQSEITLSCGGAFTEGETYTANVSLFAVEDINALSLQIHFDSSVLEATETTNYASAEFYDHSIQKDSLAYSYIFNSIDLFNFIQLFSFSFRIQDGVIPGNYYFDVIVSDAYNNSLNPVEIKTYRTYFSVTSSSGDPSGGGGETPPVVNSAYGFLTCGEVTTSYNESFTFTYYLDSLEPSSGTFVITYDDQLFEFVSLTKLGFFDDMICDYNANTKGQIYVSFAAVSKAVDTSLFTIELKTIDNVSAGTSISLIANELYDSEMNPMSFGADSLSVNTQYVAPVINNPKMETTYSINTDDHLISLDITLEEQSHLGAGDFILKFDKEIVTYAGCTKHFSPTYFNVNDKSQQLEQGQVKFSILSTSDILKETHVITFAFSYNESSQIQNADFTLTGSGLTDALTNPIRLDISGVSVEVPATDFISIWANTYLYMGDAAFEGNGTGKCKSEGLYALAKQELLKLDNYSINSFRNNVDNRYTASLARYLAWATACHDDSPFEATIEGAQHPVFKNINQNQAMTIFGSIVVLLGLTGIGILFYKRKHL